MLGWSGHRIIGKPGGRLIGWSSGRVIKINHNLQPPPPTKPPVKPTRPPQEHKNE